MPNKKFIKENMNPEGKNIGDCVLRSLAKMFQDELTYSEIKDEMARLVVEASKKSRYAYKDVSELEKNFYTRPFNYEEFIKEANMIAVDVRDYLTRKTSENMKSVSTFGRLQKFAKQEKISPLAVSNSHMAFINKEGIYDTWDSSRRIVREFYIHIDDAKKLGLLNDKDIEKTNLKPEKIISVYNVKIEMQGKTFKISKD